MSLTPPSSGEFRDRIRIDREIKGPNVGGETEGSWAPLIRERRSAVLPTRGGDQVIADRLSGDVGYDIWLRSDSATRCIRVGDRAVNLRTGEAYSLGMPIDPTNRRQWLLIQATSKGSGPDGQS